MKKNMMIVLLLLCMALSLMRTVALAVDVTAVPNASAVLVNGKSVAFDAYTINQNNYFKLRDLAAALNGTSKGFEVGWDGGKNAITLIAGKPYTAVGGELAPGNGVAKPAAAGQSALYLNERQLYLTAYVIGGNNYFKLRDVMEQLDVYVGWDGAKNLITIDTSKSYEQQKTTAPVEPAPKWIYFSDRQAVTGWEKEAATGGYLAKIRPDGTGYQVLAKDYAIEPVEYKGWIYYYRCTTDDKWDRHFYQEIYRIRPDGTGRQQVAKMLDKRVTSYSIYEDKIYYATTQSFTTSADGKEYRGLWSMNLDGSGLSKILSAPEEIWNSITVHDGRIYGVRQGGTEGSKDFSKRNNLWSIKLDGTDLKPLFSSYVNQNLIHYEDEWIYFHEDVRFRTNANEYKAPPSTALSRIRYDGTGYTMLYEGNTNGIVLIGDWIYFTGGSHPSLPQITTGGLYLFRMRTDGTQFHCVGLVKDLDVLSTARGMLFNAATPRNGWRWAMSQPTVLVFDGKTFVQQNTASTKAAPLLAAGQAQGYPDYAISAILEKPTLVKKTAEELAAEAAAKQEEEDKFNAATAHFTKDGVKDGWYTIIASPAETAGWTVKDGKVQLANSGHEEIYIENLGNKQVTLKLRSGKYLGVVGAAKNGLAVQTVDAPYAWTLTLGTHWTSIDNAFFLTMVEDAKQYVNCSGEKYTEGTPIITWERGKNSFMYHGKFQVRPVK